MSSPCLAVPLNVLNPGFEDITGESPFNEFTFGPLNGWDLYDPSGITGGGAGGTYFIGTLTPFEPEPVANPGVYANFPAGAPEGQRVAIAFNFQGSDGQGEYGLQQILSDTLQPNTLYTLQVEVGDIDSATAMNGSFFPLEGFPGYRIDLFARNPGGVEVDLESDNNSLAGLIDDGEFATSTITFVTGAEHPQLGNDLGIRLVNLNELDPDFPLSDIEVDFDDVRLEATVLTPGDLDGNGDVEGGDFLSWQQNTANVYGAMDLSNWTSNYGVGPSPSASSTHAVPEPSAVLILLVAFLSWIRVLR
ncbi:MAG: hypothetical protein RH917_13220 [Lacipirellulaceae bacterium]